MPKVHRSSEADGTGSNGAGPAEGAEPTKVTGKGATPARKTSTVAGSSTKKAAAPMAAADPKVPTDPNTSKVGGASGGGKAAPGTPGHKVAATKSAAGAARAAPAAAKARPDAVGTGAGPEAAGTKAAATKEGPEAAATKAGGSSKSARSAAGSSVKAPAQTAAAGARSGAASGGPRSASAPARSASEHARRPAAKSTLAAGDRPRGPVTWADGSGAEDDLPDDVFLDQQRLLLIQERASYVRQAEELKAEADSLALEHEPGDVQFDEEGGEGGTSNVDRELDLVLSAQARSAINEIDRAMAKIAAGSYGRCEQCGRPIPQARLQALPYASLCVACKSGGLSRR